MEASKYIRILCFLINLLISNTTCAPTTNADPYTIKELHFTESTTNKINPSTVPLTELIQKQTDTIKKILSSSLHASNQDKIINTPNKCDDIETGIKESIRKSNFQQDEITEIVSEDPEKRGDTLTEASLIKQEKKTVPTGRTLFNLYSNEFARTDDFTTTSNPVITTNNYQDNQNIILVPCVKRIIDNGTRRNIDENSFVNQNYQFKQTNDQLIHSIDTSQAYILEKVYSPQGYLLYYMYRLKNTNPEQQSIDYTSSSSTTTPSTTSTSSTTTSTTSSPMPDSLYSQQMKFVIQMPFAEPEQMESYGYKFDQFAYYPPELQPNYVNAPVPYKPTYHMIRTLIIPNEFSQQNSEEYVLNNQQNANNEK